MKHIRERNQPSCLAADKDTAARSYEASCAHLILIYICWFLRSILCHLVVLWGVSWCSLPFQVWFLVLYFLRAWCCARYAVLWESRDASSCARDFPTTQKDHKIQMECGMFQVIWVTKERNFKLPNCNTTQLEKEVTMTTDASKCAIAAVLTQEGHPVKYISRTLSTAEKNYSNIEREALAIVWSISRLQHFLLGRKFILTTNHFNHYRKWLTHS